MRVFGRKKKKTDAGAGADQKTKTRAPPPTAAEKSDDYIISRFDTDVPDPEVAEKYEVGAATVYSWKHKFVSNTVH